MIVDAEKIISDTVKVFFSSEEQKKKFSELDQFISIEEYNKIHTDFLVPLDIKIDCELFLQEIKNYDNLFEQWGNEHTHLPRYGLALVNLDGKLKTKDPINGSLYEWNVKNSSNPIIESDCKIPTPVMNMQSLKPLEHFNNYWFRSNILKWGNTAEFKPHIDSIVPSPWLRLWGTTDADNTEVRFWDHQTKTMKAIQGIESGRIYLIDTSKVHDAVSRKEVYQFFLSVSPAALNIVKELICHR